MFSMAGISHSLQQTEHHNVSCVLLHTDWREQPLGRMLYNFGGGGAHDTLISL